MFGCAFAVGGIILDPINVFLWLWMIVGVFGLILGPYLLLQLFTVYEFEEERTVYILRIKSIWRKKTIVIPKCDFIGFKYVVDEEYEKETSLLYVEFKQNSSIRKVYVLRWLKKEYQKAVVSSLNWRSS